MNCQRAEAAGVASSGTRTGMLGVDEGCRFRSRV